MRRSAIIWVVALVLIGSGCSLLDQGSDSADDEDLPLPARWWIWAESVPAEQNPILDQTGEFCDVNQPDDVWFLAGTFGVPAMRKCTIPRDRPIYFPVINTICPAVPGASGDQALASCFVQNQPLRATLDGKKLRIEEADSEGIFTIDLAEGSRLGSGEGDFVTVGSWVGPLDLTPGRHVLKFSASSSSVGLNVTYRLTVE